MRHYILAGDPVAHSLSPKIYSELFLRFGVDADFRAVRIAKGELNKVLEMGLSGFACTMPHKQDIIPFLTHISDAARTAGSVNVVRADTDGLSGFSTDGGGLLRALADMDADTGCTAIYGTGGAARAAAYALTSAGGRVTLYGRNTDARQELCACFSCTDGGEYPRDLSGAGVFINASPLGMAGRGDYPELGFLDTMGKSAAVYDMVYAPKDTALTLSARSRGLRTDSGLSMLKYQAYLAFELWTGISPDALTQQNH